jgi:hypothetical protein
MVSPPKACLINAAEEIPSASSICETQRILVLFDFVVLDEVFLTLDFLDLIDM